MKLSNQYLLRQLIKPIDPLSKGFRLRGVGKDANIYVVIVKAHDNNHGNQKLQIFRQ